MENFLILALCTSPLLGVGALCFWILDRHEMAVREYFLINKPNTQYSGGNLTTPAEGGANNIRSMR